MARKHQFPTTPKTGNDRRDVLPLLIAAMLAAAAPTVSAGQPGFYAGLSSGVAVLDVPGGGSLDSLPGLKSFTQERDRLSASTLYGGYRFSRGFALEAARISFGNSVTTDDEALLYSAPAERMSAWSVAGVGSLLVTDSVWLFGKLGMNFSPDTANSGFAVENPTQPGKVYGFGLSYQASANLELRAQSERFTGLGQTAAGELEANALTFGARLRF
jgi:Outer membrane protein beta-barrel domain